MKRNSFLKTAAASIAIALPVLASAAKTSDEARLLRFPAVGGDNIVFTYAGDLYRVGINGGEAVRLTSHIGYETFARISPDGKTIAFTGQYDGNTEVYTLPITGGEPKRITYSALVSRDNVGERMGPNNIVMCWTPDGKQIVYRSKTHNFSGLRGQLCKVSAEGGVREEIPTSEGGFCSYSPDGKYLAFNRMFREFRTWKYYRGGQADDIWVNEVGTNSLKKICENDAQDIFPMWIGDDIYYMSDRDRVMNLFVYHNASGKTEKVTDFKEYDCKFPSFSQEYVVFENGGYIYKYSVKSGKCEKVNVTLKADNVYGRTETVNVSNKISDWAMSPDGSRVIMIGRGDVYSLPAKQGAVFDITATPGVHERSLLWSPDGKKIAYVSDADGEDQIYMAPADDMTKAVKLTSFKSGYPTSLIWSPDSKKIYFKGLKREMYCLDVDSKSCKKILFGEYGAINGFTLSKDGTWAAYNTSLSNRTSAIFLYDVAAGKSYQLTDKWYDASGAKFSDDGKYLFFTSARNFRATSSAVEWNRAYSVTSYAFFVPLAADTPNPLVISNDGNVVEKKAEQADKKGTKVDIEGIGQRISAFPFPAGSYRFICSAGDKMLYTTEGSLKAVDMKTLKVSDAGKSVPLVVSPDRKKALIRENGKFAVVSFGASGCGKADKYVPTQDMVYTLDHQAEWKQIFEESWRITRDNFYVSNMHGANWNKVHDKYAVLVPYVRHRHDLTYIIGEMIGELNVGHAYITSGENPAIPRIATGLLGAKFSKDAKTGAFRIEKIFRGANWDKSLRSPLTEPGSEAKVGEYVVAVNGTPAKDLVDIYQALIGKAEKVVELQIASNAKGSDARKVYVKTISDEANLAYYEWVQNNIEKVEKASNGQIGYIHIPDMGSEGMDMFTKLFYTQLDKKALIIDDRMNGGGNVSPIILERLQREVYRISMYNNGTTVPVPNEAFYGPQVCLIDKYSSSDGDLFPYSYRKLGLGKLIGKRSWGGIVGISGSRSFLDGQDMRTPFFTSYSTDGEWIIEGHGVDPDIEVDINPFDDYNGLDAQLDKAVEYLKGELKNWKALPGIPKAPVKN